MQHYSETDGRAETQIRVVVDCRKAFINVVAANHLRRHLYAQGRRTTHYLGKGTADL